jgi:hypothetical protein
VRRTVPGMRAVLLCALALAGCTSGSPVPPLAPPGGAAARATEGDEAGAIRRSDFQVTYRLEGVTRESPLVGVLPNPLLALASSVSEEATVVQGQALGEAGVDPRVRHLATRDGKGNDLDKSRLAQVEAMGGTVKAPVDGVFTERGGTPVVLADGIDVVVDLTPIQHLRSRSFRFTGQAVVETVVGVRQVPCAAVWTEHLAARGEDAASARLHCRLPRLVETAAGLRARVILTTQRIVDAVVVLNTYIGYDAAKDGYFLTIRGRDGDRRIPVTVGATDGVRRIILSDVPVGATLVRPPEGGTVD